MEEKLFGVPPDADIHDALDALGMVPVFGEVADGVNGILYLIDGDYVNAGISGTALIPVGGQFATGTRIVKGKVSKRRNAFQVSRATLGPPERSCRI